MIEVHTLRGKSERAVGIHSLGHADCGNGITNIVCAIISTLELDFASSAEELTDVKFEVHLGEGDGSFDFKLLGERNGEAELLLQSLLLGYQTVQEAYSNSYLMIKDQEV